MYFPPQTLKLGLATGLTQHRDWYTAWWSKSSCRGFITPWSQNGSFQTPQSCQFSNIFLFWSIPMVMNRG